MTGNGLGCEFVAFMTYVDSNNDNLMPRNFGDIIYWNIEFSNNS